MSQILNIFRKDTRRFWPEILISVALTLAFAAAFPNQWKAFRDPVDSNRMRLIVIALGFLMVMSWWLLIARVVHAETLVGDRQFWITRPYEWQKLLAAKVLFVVAWVGVPYLLAQCLVRVEAGFSPAPDAPALLLNLLMTSTVFLLPLFSVATVTANFARLTFTLLACLAATIGYAFLTDGIPHSYIASNPYNASWIVYPLLFCGCAVAIALEYATRRVWVSRALLIVLPVLLALSEAAYSRQSLVDRAYPAPNAASAAPFNAAIAPKPNSPIDARSYEGADYIDLPIHYSGVADGYAVVTADFRFTLTAADGSEWTSPWQEFRDHIGPSGQSSGFSLMIDPALYDRFKSGPVTLRITFAVDRYQADSVATVPYPAAGAAVPGLGICAADGFANTLICRSALRDPRLTYYTVTWSQGPCSGASGATTTGDGWREPDRADFGPSPVWTYRMFFRRGDEHWRICPGSPLTVTQYHLVERTQAGFTFPNFVLPAYVQPT